MQKPPNLGDFSQVTVNTTVAAQVWNAQPGTSVLLANQDPTVTITLGRRPNFTPGGPNTLQLAPYASATIDGSKTIYALANAVGITPGALVVIPGGGSWSPGIAQLAPAGPSTAATMRVGSVVGQVGAANTNMPLDPSGNPLGSKTIRLWGAYVNLSAVTLAAFAGGLFTATAFVNSIDSIELCHCVVLLNAANQTGVASAFLDLRPSSYIITRTVALGIAGASLVTGNAGVIANTATNANGFVLYSLP